YLDTGAMYRAGALRVAQVGENPADEAAVAAVAQRLSISFGALQSDGSQTVFINEQNATALIRSPEVSQLTSVISALPAVRREIVHKQRQLGYSAPLGLVAEGRDTTTVVFPNAHLKVFLTASEQVRAQRRADQLYGAGASTSLTDVLAEQRARDRRDSTRADSPLQAPEGGLIMNTDHLSAEDAARRIEEALNRALQRRPDYTA
ncbi:MAG TPA: (d)CMP kinase, partial [Chthonomonadales bacterium]|nr:(d)CMP kinase [Chthonomonadales bacterium]